ncbi:hypothetical protein [Pseudogracilibacillus sp. SO30301A]|uniref:hypothetical protein n=1 Tax=Pseudogracilibacillus sp. SO30301A TaxID=3098291 RepID=UPI00300E2ABF
MESAEINIRTYSAEERPKQNDRHPLTKRRLIVLVSLSITLIVVSLFSLMAEAVSFSINEKWNGLFGNHEVTKITT